MARYHYKARNAQGQAVEGLIEAPDTHAAAQQLINTGATPIDIRDALVKAASPLKKQIRFGSGKPTLSEVTLFTRQAYALNKAGVPIIRGFTQLADSARNPVLALAIEQIVEDLEAGRDLAGAMAKHTKIFSPLYINMIRVGEETGRLDEAFSRMHQYLEREKETVSQIKTALRYPMIVITTVILAVVILMAKVIPEFAKVFDRFNLELPLPTRIIIGASNFVAQYWWLLLVLSVGGIYGFVHYVKTDAGQLWWDEKKLKIPLVGSIVLRATLARFARAFSMASRSGVPLMQALRVVARAVDNEYMAQKIVAMREGIERGESIARTAATMGVFTPLVLQMLSVGEETGQVDEMLEEVAEFYETEVDYDVKNFADLIQPILTLAVGAIVFILALGVFLPMWDLTKIAGH